MGAVSAWERSPGDKTNPVKILSLDAKDIWLSNHSSTPSSVGYRIRDKNGDITLKKFTNDLDDSLDLMKLREIYQKTYRNNRFSFFRDKKEYTQQIINVTFLYNNKEFNRVAPHTYIKFGYDLEALNMEDCVCVRAGELIAITVGRQVQCPVEKDILGKYFYYENGMYRAKQNIGVLNTVASLRQELYENGFNCDGIHYVRFKRSAGSSRVGKCLFINERLYSRMHRWEMCGIRIPKRREVDLAALEAYISLPLSSIIGTVEINPNNILVVDDYESQFYSDVAAVTVVGGRLEAKEENARITNSIFDGQSLISPEIMGRFADKGFILLRNRFFKSACFNCNIQKWFADNRITYVAQLKGHTTAKTIGEIQLITTPSSIKYLKFGSLADWLKQLTPLFGVVKHEKKTHFFDGRMVQLHYQLLNTLQLSEQEVATLLEPSLEYLKQIKADPAVLKYYIKYAGDGAIEEGPALSKNDIVYKMLGTNEKFAGTKLYHDFKQELIKAYKKNLRCGHVLVNGNYATLLGNPVEMLQHSIGAFDGESQLGKNNIHCTRFSYGKRLLGSRSPHVTMGNILVANNAENTAIDRYFNLSEEIVCVNSIGENLLNRLSGAD